jgi:hypothetical protein
VCERERETETEERERDREMSVCVCVCVCVAYSLLHRSSQLGSQKTKPVRFGRFR